MGLRQRFFFYLLSPYRKVRRSAKEGRIKKAKLIFNPLAGKGREAKPTLRKIKVGLKKRKPELKMDVSFSREQGDATACAREAVRQGYELVIAAGGDGTINEVVQALARTKVILGIIPLGVGNIFAQEVGIPVDVDLACEVLSFGEVERVDLGKMGERHFLWIAGVGQDAQVVQALDEVSKEAMTTYSYLRLALNQLRKIHPMQVKVQVDGEVVEQRAIMVEVGNAATFDDGKRVRVRPRESINDGYLDVCIIGRFNAISVFRGVYRFFSGHHNCCYDIKYLSHKYYKAKEVIIDSYPPTFIHLDGEPRGMTPAKFEVAPKSLSLILPPR